jgi:predicted nucleic acid-binding protein
VLVIDTNVLAAFLLPAQQTSAAVAVHTRDPEWAAPALWRSELCSVLVQNVRAGRLDLAAAASVMQLAVELIVHEQDALSSEVLGLAIDSGCSPYDCEFVAVAQALGAPLVTLDRALLREFPDLALTPADFAGRR